MPTSMSKGHRALRLGRCSVQGQVYLLTTTTSDRRPVFSDWRVALAVSSMLQNAVGDARWLCWMLMPDHLHVLLQLGEDTLSRVVAQLKSRSGCIANQALGTPGRPVWSPAFHDRAIRREEDVLPAARYVILNPVRAGLVRSVGAYPFWNARWLN